MTASALIAHVLDPLIEPQFAEQDLLFDKTFSTSDDRISRDYLRGLKRCSTYGVDWAGDKLLVAAKDNMLRLFDAEKGEEERAWPGEWMAMQCDPNNPTIAAAVSWHGKFKVFDTRSSSHSVFEVDLKKTSSAMKEFLWLCWAPDSKRIAVNNRQDQVFMLDVRTAGSLRLGGTKNFASEVNQMVWAADGDALWVATGGTPGKIQVLPSPSMSSEGSVSVVGHQHTTIGLACDRTGRHIASSGGDCLVALWDPKHFVCTRTFPYATQVVSTLDFNHNGQLLAWGTGGSGSSGGEKNITIVGADTGTLYWQDTTTAPVQFVKWHPKRQVIAYTLNYSQIPDERDQPVRDRRLSSRELAAVHMLKIPE